MALQRETSDLDSAIRFYNLCTDTTPAAVRREALVWLADAALCALRYCHGMYYGDVEHQPPTFRWQVIEENKPEPDCILGEYNDLHTAERGLAYFLYHGHNAYLMEDTQ